MFRRLPSYARPLAVLVAAYTIVFFYLGYRKYAVFGSDGGDYAFFDNMFWWTVRGYPFYCSGNGFSNFGIHAAFLWVQLVPFYWLCPGIPTLLFMQSLFLGAMAVPMYLIAREILQDHRTALVMAATLILMPPIVSQNVNQLEEPPFMGVYILFMFYFFMKGRFGLFLLFAGISCLGRENVPLAVVMFGVYSLILRREKKWFVVPIVAGLIYFWLAVFVLMPYFRHGHQWHVMRMFRYLGDTPGTIVLNALSHPVAVIDHLLGQENVMYLILLFQPLGWVLPFFSPASLMALPDLAINTISDNSALKVIPWHYNVVTGCFLFIGTIYVVKRIGAWWRPRFGGNPEIVMAVILLLLSIANWPIWLNLHQYRQLPYHATVLRAIEAVPPDKSVIASLRVQSHLGAREHFHNLGSFVQFPDFAAQFEYVILDANERQYPPFITQEFFDSFQHNPKYRVVFAEQNVIVFQRLGGESDWKIPVP